MDLNLIARLQGQSGSKSDFYGSGERLVINIADATLSFYSEKSLVFHTSTFSMWQLFFKL